MPVPQLKQTSSQKTRAAGVTYRIDGDLGPVVTVETGGKPVFFEHHLMLWKDTSISTDVKPLEGSFKRSIHGMPIFVLESRGAGMIGFSRNGTGQATALNLDPGQSVDVREHQWIAATGNVEYTFKRISGIANVVFSDTGIFIDTFTCSGAEPGILWDHGYGNVFEIMLPEGEQIDLEPGGWIYKDRSVKMETIVQRLSTGFMAASAQFISSRFTGPGRVGIQSHYVHVGPTEGS